MVKDVMEEVIIVGRDPMNNWRRDNLLKCKNLIDKGTYYEISFQYVDHTNKGVQQVKLTYKLLK